MSFVEKSMNLMYFLLVSQLEEEKEACHGSFLLLYQQRSCLATLKFCEYRFFELGINFLTNLAFFLPLVSTTP